MSPNSLFRWSNRFIILICVIGPKNNDLSEPQTYQALVAQLNAEDDQLNYQPTPDLSTILAQLRRLDLKKAPGFGGGFNSYSAATSGEPEDEISEVFDFFAMFQAFYQLKRFFANNPNINPFLSKSANSIALLYRAVILDYEAIAQTTSKSQEQQLIKHFILLSELQVTALSLGQKQPYEDANPLLQQIEENLTELEPQFKALIARSTMLKQFLHASAETEHVTDKAMLTIYNWFKTQLSNCNE